ncbi:MAG TPA: hypothetical protein VFO94_11690 [Gammaproteobacteria bacterium]|nr:hypothetical protein [Gammaproteobacteria bacterium]
MEVAAFWIALAAVIVAGGWYKSRTEAQKHQTFRTIVEKTGTVDESQLKLLFAPPEVLKRLTASGDTRGDAYRFLRGIGAVVMFIGVGILFFAGVMTGMLHSANDANLSRDLATAMAMSGVVFLFGAGLFYASRFAEKPPAGSERPSIGRERE